MSEEQEEKEEQGMVENYIRWLFKGNMLVVPLKFLWTGMWITAITTLQFIKAGVIIFVGVLVWFIVNDYENWYIELKD